MRNDTKLLDSFQRLLRAFQRRPQSLRTDTAERAQGRMLKVIAKNEGITARKLADILEIRQASLTAKVGQMEEQGYVRRVRDKKDARLVRIFITEKGLRVLANRSPSDPTIPAFSDCLSEQELAHFIDMCKRLTENVERIAREDKEAFLLHKATSPRSNGSGTGKRSKRSRG